MLLTASEALEVCAGAVSVPDLNEMQRWEGNLSLNHEVMESQEEEELSPVI